MHIRDRIRELRRVPVSELRPHPRNWRNHPDAQRDAMRGVLAEIGYADALLARELPDGSLEMIDGHLRAETTPEAVVPVLVLDVTAAEADKILLTHDPLAAMAAADQERLSDLLSLTDFDNPPLEQMLDGLARDAAKLDAALAADRDPPEIDVGEFYQVVVECQDEADQQAVYERMRAEGYECRVLTL